METITILKRYDVNGAFTHDFDFRIGIVKTEKNSMYKLHGVFKLVRLDIFECHKCGELIDSTEDEHVFCPHCLDSL